MTRLDEREIAGASENIDNAPDLIELRKSNRRRVIKRYWEQAEASKPRKRRRLTQLLTPISTQTTSQTFTIYDEEQQAARSLTRETIPRIQSKRIIPKTLRKTRSCLRGIGNTYNSREIQKARPGTILSR